MTEVMAMEAGRATTAAADYDSFDDDGFDEAFADLIESLRETETGLLSLSKNLRTETSGLLAEINESDVTKTDGSPYERFRKQRGMLSVFSFMSL
jgi:hypothetical protein